MRELIGIFTAKKDSKTLETYLDAEEGTYCFEVKDGDRVLYRGDSFQKARQTYENSVPESS